MSDTIKAQIDTLAAFPDALKRQVQGLSDAALRFRPTPDDWSIVEIVGHIIDVGALWPGRTRQMLATENPALTPVDANWVRQRDYQNKQIGFLLITLADHDQGHSQQIANNLAAFQSAAS